MAEKPTTMSAGVQLFRLLPGVVLTATIAASAWLLHRLSGQFVLSPLLMSVLFGIVICNAFSLPESTRPGTVFTARMVLRSAIALLGFQLSVAQLAEIGIGGLVIVVFVVCTTFAATTWLGERLGVDAKLAALIGAGTSICGASAVFAMSTVIESDEEDIVYAIASVTLFGTILMFLLPAIAHAGDLGAREFGIWAGASVHEIAQVTGAGFQLSQEAGESSILIKLARVLMLAPLVMFVGLKLGSRSTARARDAKAAPAFPLFILGFLVAGGVNSVTGLPISTQQSLMTLTSFMLTMALAAFGLQTSLGNLKAKGVRPLALGTAASLYIVLLSYALVRIIC